MAEGLWVFPKRLNAVMAGAFMIGSACFAVGVIPQYVDAVGTFYDAVTFFTGSVFFTTASFCQLVQTQSPQLQPGTTTAGRGRVRFTGARHYGRGGLSAATQFPGTIAFNVSTWFAINASLTATQTNRLVWVPDFVGSILFLVASGFGILAVTKRFAEWHPRDVWWQIAWLNMVGSIFFMMSAVGAKVIPATGEMIDIRWANLGTGLGAICFFIGAWLLLPAWRKAEEAKAAGQ